MRGQAIVLSKIDKFQKGWNTDHEYRLSVCFVWKNRLRLVLLMILIFTDHFFDLFVICLMLLFGGRNGFSLYIVCKV